MLAVEDDQHIVPVDEISPLGIASRHVSDEGAIVARFAIQHERQVTRNEAVLPVRHKRGEAKPFDDLENGRFVMNGKERRNVHKPTSGANDSTRAWSERFSALPRDARDLTEPYVSLSSGMAPILTVPASPSTVIVWPFLMNCVPWPVPMTAGIPYSRATMEPCARTP